MAGKRDKPEEIVLKLRQVEVLQGQGKSIADAVRQIGVRHYNTERPHRGRGIGNNVLEVDFRPARDGPIRRRRQLGGIITSYTRDAA